MTAQRKLAKPQFVIHRLERVPGALEAAERFSSQRDRAIGTVASKLLENETGQNRENRSGLSYELQLLAQLPDFIDAQRQLDRLKTQSQHGKNVSQAEMDKWRRRAGPFNRTLQDVVDNSPLLMSQVTDFAVGSRLALVSSEDASYSEEKVTDALNNARHAIAFEGLQYYIDGVEKVERADTPMQEILGIDTVVTYRGRPYAFDVTTTEARALGRARSMQMHGHDDITPIWSGFTDRDFDGSLRITDQRIIREGVTRVQNILEEIYDIDSVGQRSGEAHTSDDSRIYS